MVTRVSWTGVVKPKAKDNHGYGFEGTGNSVSLFQLVLVVSPHACVDTRKVLNLQVRQVLKIKESMEEF